NPTVLERTRAEYGMNLIRGASNLIEDVARLRTGAPPAGMEAFRVGETVAATPGKVVHRTRLAEIIQYAPTTGRAHPEPIVIVPAWIMKYYILDLSAKNSLVRYFVGQGFTVFMISWKNPTDEDRDLGMDEYRRLGVMAALDAIGAIVPNRRVHGVGYCLGGTLLAATLAYLAARNDDRIQTATYFVTLVDFTDVGDMAVFIDEEQLAILEKRMRSRGYFAAHDMALAFNMLRANDLIWSFVVSNYLLGKQPIPFDFLYWNADSTRMPATMHSFYLRNMYHENRLVIPGGISFAGVPIDLTRIKTPTFLLSTREDHIAPWQSTYAVTQLYKGPTKFVLADSGHIAGVISPPGSKYGHWQNPNLPKSPAEWFETARLVQTSWWLAWEEWVS
ncbi:MAG: PHA/PHB synthase family protein, partial [Gammaproteobacteria bacterium]